jgi:PadR family transcriptional regulator PadR
LHARRNPVYVEAGGIVPPPKSDLPQGTLDMLILQVLALEPLHGYAIAQRIRQISREVVRVPQGSLYPALHRLENRNVLVADWKQSETGRDAKYYRLTAQGRKYLKSETENWLRLSAAIRLILRAPSGGTT